MGDAEYGALEDDGGAIAFTRSGDPKTVEFEPAKIIKIFGEVPAEDALMSDGRGHATSSRLG